MMVRTQIMLDSEMQRRARERAGQLGISLAEYVRRVLARDLGDAGPPADPTAVFDLGNSGGANVARDKDTMIGEAVSAEAERERSS